MPRYIRADRVITASAGGNPLTNVRSVDDVEVVYVAGRRLGPLADGWIP